MIVLVLVGTGMTTLYQLLKAVWAENLSGNTGLQIQQFFRFGRQKALQDGKIVTMVLDLENREMGLRLYNPLLEDVQDRALDSLARKAASDSFRIRQFLEKLEEREKELAKESEPTRKQEEKWILQPTALPSDLTKIYSVGGSELTAPKIFVHFYPNSTSDSLIFKFDRGENPYLYLPRYNVPAVYLASLSTVENFIKDVAE